MIKRYYVLSRKHGIAELAALPGPAVWIRWAKWQPPPHEPSRSLSPHFSDSYVASEFFQASTTFKFVTTGINHIDFQSFISIIQNFSFSLHLSTRLGSISELGDSGRFVVGVVFMEGAGTVLGGPEVFGGSVLLGVRRGTGSSPVVLPFLMVCFGWI